MFNVRSTASQGYEARLYHAIREGDIEEVNLCVKQGVNLQHQDENGNTPLLLALYCKQADVAMCLVIALRNDPNLRSINVKNCVGNTALLLATSKGYLDIVEELYELGANLDEENKAGNGALYLAAVNHHIEVMEWLLMQRADLTQQNSAGKTLLEQLILESQDSEHEEVVKSLLAHGAYRYLSPKSMETVKNSAYKSLFAEVEHCATRYNEGLAQLGADTNRGWDKILNAAVLGHVRAQIDWAQHCIDENIERKDVIYFLQCADYQKHKDAAFRLATFYKQSAAKKKALFWYKRAELRGHTEATAERWRLNPQTSTNQSDQFLLPTDYRKTDKLLQQNIERNKEAHEFTWHDKLKQHQHTYKARFKKDVNNAIHWILRWDQWCDQVLEQREYRYEMLALEYSKEWDLGFRLMPALIASNIRLSKILKENVIPKLLEKIGKLKKSVNQHHPNLANLLQEFYTYYDARLNSLTIPSRNSPTFLGVPFLHHPKLGSIALNKQTADCLLQPKIIKDAHQGRHSIISYLGVHYKCLDNDSVSMVAVPGLEFMVDRLYKLVVGQGTAPSTLIKVTQAKKSRLFQAIQTVKGVDLLHMLDNCPEDINRIDPENFSALILMGLLTNPQDGTPQNYMVEEGTKDNGEKVFNIVGIDNDMAFGKAVIKRGEEYYPKVRNVLYFFPQMERVVAPSIRNDFVRCSPEKILIEWLRTLAEYNQDYERMRQEGIFTKKEFEGDGVSQNRGLELPILLPDNLVPTLYERIQALQRILAANPEVTHNDLLQALEPILYELHVKFIRKHIPGRNLHVLPALPPGNQQREYAFSYIVANNKVYDIFPEGLVYEVKIDDMDVFLRSLDEIRQNGETMFLSNERIAELITANGGYVRSNPILDAFEDAYIYGLKQQLQSELEIPLQIRRVEGSGRRGEHKLMSQLIYEARKNSVPHKEITVMEALIQLFDIIPFFELPQGKQSDILREAEKISLPNSSVSLSPTELLHHILIRYAQRKQDVSYLYLKLLQHHEANINAFLAFPGMENYQSLHYAATRLGVATVRGLMALGAEVNRKDKTSGKTPFELVIEQGETFLQILIDIKRKVQEGANVNAHQENMKRLTQDVQRLHETAIELHRELRRLNIKFDSASEKRFQQWHAEYLSVMGNVGGNADEEEMSFFYAPSSPSVNQPFHHASGRKSIPKRVWKYPKGDPSAPLTSIFEYLVTKKKRKEPNYDERLADFVLMLSYMVQTSPPHPFSYQQLRRMIYDNHEEIDISESKTGTSHLYNKLRDNMAEHFSTARQQLAEFLRGLVALPDSSRHWLGIRTREQCKKEVADELIKCISERVTRWREAISSAEVFSSLPPKELVSIRWALLQLGEVMALTEDRQAEWSDCQEIVSLVRIAAIISNILWEKTHSFWQNQFSLFQHNETALKVNYSLCLTLPETLESNKLYIDILAASIQYTVIDPQGQKVTDYIGFDAIDSQLSQPITLEKLQRHLFKIVKIAASRGHAQLIHPQGVARAPEVDARIREAVLGVNDGLAMIVQVMNAIRRTHRDNLRIVFSSYELGQDKNTVFQAINERYLNSVLVGSNHAQIQLELEKAMKMRCDLHSVSILPKYTLCLMTPDTRIIEPNKLYVEFLGEQIQYTVINPRGERVTNSIRIKDIAPELTSPDRSKTLGIDQLQPYAAKILTITSDNDHTIGLTNYCLSYILYEGELWYMDFQQNLVKVIVEDMPSLLQKLNEIRGHRKKISLSHDQVRDLVTSKGGHSPLKGIVFGATTALEEALKKARRLNKVTKIIEGAHMRFSELVKINVVASDDEKSRFSIEEVVLLARLLTEYVNVTVTDSEQYAQDICAIRDTVAALRLSDAFFMFTADDLFTLLGQRTWLELILKKMTYPFVSQFEQYRDVVANQERIGELLVQLKALRVQNGSGRNGAEQEQIEKLEKKLIYQFTRQTRLADALEAFAEVLEKLSQRFPGQVASQKLAQLQKNNQYLRRCIRATDILQTVKEGIVCINKEMKLLQTSRARNGRNQKIDGKKKILNHIKTKLNKQLMDLRKAPVHSRSGSGRLVQEIEMGLEELNRVGVNDVANDTVLQCLYKLKGQYERQLKAETAIWEEVSEFISGQPSQEIIIRQAPSQAFQLVSQAMHVPDGSHDDLALLLLKAAMANDYRFQSYLFPGLYQQELAQAEKDMLLQLDKALARVRPAESPLPEWCRHTREEIIQWLQTLTLNCQEKDLKNCTLLHIALGSKQLEAARVLFAMGIDLNARDALRRMAHDALSSEMQIIFFAALFAARKTSELADRVQILHNSQAAILQRAGSPERALISYSSMSIEALGYALELNRQCYTDIQLYQFLGEYLREEVLTHGEMLPPFAREIQAILQAVDTGALSAILPLQNVAERSIVLASPIPTEVAEMLAAKDQLMVVVREESEDKDEKIIRLEGENRGLTQENLVLKQEKAKLTQEKAELTQRLENLKERLEKLEEDLTDSEDDEVENEDNPPAPQSAFNSSWRRKSF